MSSQETFSFDLYPGLDAELDAALNRNIAGGTANPDVIARGGLGAAIAGAVTQANLDPLANANLAPGFRQELESAHAATAQLLEMSPNLQRIMPPLDSEVFADADWDKLQTTYAGMLGAGLQPEIVVSPLATSLDYWEDIFEALPGTKDGGLYINDEVKNAWDEVNGPETDRWSIDIVPATSEPTAKNVPHNLSKMDLHGALGHDTSITDTFDFGAVSSPAEFFPELSTYLTMQATRLMRGQEPIDAGTATWLRGTFDNNTKAPYADWFPGGGQVRVYWRSPGFQRGGIGVRPAVRGLYFEH